MANSDEQGYGPSSLICCNLGLGLVFNRRPIYSDILHPALPTAAAALTLNVKCMRVCGTWGSNESTLCQVTGQMWVQGVKLCSTYELNESPLCQSVTNDDVERQAEQEHPHCLEAKG